MEKNYGYPFSAIVGQEEMKLALLLNVVNPRLGGVLIQGEKGTAKSTAVRGLAALIPQMKVVELPVSATEDRVVGTLNLEKAPQEGEKRFSPGLLAEADGNILYVDEINLLEDHIVDLLLDAAAMGVNHVEREGISCEHPARFILVGTMNPEEGQLRPVRPDGTGKRRAGDEGAHGGHRKKTGLRGRSRRICGAVGGAGACAHRTDFAGT